MTELRPFTVDVPPAALDDLRRRLDAVRAPDQPAGAGWEYGVPGDYLGELVRYWREEFDWLAVQDELNAWPQVITTIGGQPVHAIHARSAHADATPLLLLHGWPSTVADFLGILPALTERFHVVAPSLPGFGFSGPTLETGWDLDRHADTLLELMRRLGYERFVVQGGDWGGLIGPHVARRAPERVAMVHVNALVTAVDWTSGDPTVGLTAEEKAQVYALGAMWRERQGYAAIQSTRPQTLAHALNDSPVGLLAWDLEWFVDYDPETTPQTPIDRRAILDERHHDVAHRHRGLVGAHLQGGRAGLRRRAHALRGPDRRRLLPRRPRDPEYCRAISRNRALDDLRPGRALRGPASTGPVGRPTSSKRVDELCAARAW